MTQCVRRCRGRADDRDTRRVMGLSSGDEGTDKENSLQRAEDTGVENGESALYSKPSILTSRVKRHLIAMKEWNTVALIWWLYFWSLLMITLTISPRLLNVFLAWMTKVLASTSFGLVCLAMWAIGLCMFLIPVVPGAPIFFFGGALIPTKCEWGFWWGAFIAVILGWILKLSACAMQQNVIGRQLGNWMWVRQNVGVHKPFIRTIEMVLRKPGLSLGKVSILCGGPDWPTSVLAGILRLSLFQCLLGTTPIVFFVAPFALSGSFYLKKDEGEVWSRSGNLMFTVTGLVCVVLWAIMAWAWEDEFDKSNDEVTCMREEDLELDWQDYKSLRLQQRCEVRWAMVPRIVRFVYALGCLGLILVGHLFWLATSSCFGEFAVTDDIDTLEWYGAKKHSVLKFPGLAGLIIVVVGSCGLVAFRLWVRIKTRVAVRECLQELSGEEAAWKEQRLMLIRAPKSAGAVQGSSDLQQPSEADVTYVKAKSNGGADGQPPALESVRAEAASQDLPEGPTIPAAKEERLNQASSTENPALLAGAAQQEASVPVQQEPSLEARSEPPSREAPVAVAQSSDALAPAGIGSTLLPHEVCSPTSVSPR